jgi:biofilm PGA synthesis N-glycosyltransferase PgaC
VIGGRAALVVSAAIEAIERSPAYWVALSFLATYPVVSSIMWVTNALTYFLRREYRKRGGPPPLPDPPPPVSVLIAAYCEELHIRDTIESCLRLDYPDFEVVVVDDGSTDRTVAEVLPYVLDGRVRLIAKATNEGKAMALNDAIPCLRGDIVVVMDADAQPVPLMLRHLVPHFAAPRVAAVTGNPRVVDRQTLLSRLQVVEFTSIVSLQRRAQRVWGRILTMSGVVTALRRSAMVDVGMFSPDMATEDIDLTWKLQKRYYDIRYEPEAIVWMRVPTTLRGLWKQRRRWALGLAQVLGRHGRDVLGWKRRRMWPVLVESSASILWAYVFVGLTALWALSYAVGHPPAGASPFPNWWGMTIATLSLVQLGTGILLDRQYERGVERSFPVAVLYPAVYWMLMALITVRTTPGGLLRRPGGPARWRTERRPAHGGPAPQDEETRVHHPELALR